MLPQRKLREMTMQFLYSSDLNPGQTAKEGACLFDSLSVSKKVFHVVQEKLEAIFPLLESIDAMIAKGAHDYDSRRITRVEYAILRLAVFELHYDSSVPPKVAIAEAVRLSRKFATKGGGGFVNAVLDTIYREENAYTRADSK
ncbi:MAG: transcription antitermination factor NusB [Chlamydiota bacterium]